MQVKKCPKCGAENKHTNTLCCKCYVSIENAPISIVDDKPVPKLIKKAVQPPKETSENPEGIEKRPEAKTNISSTTIQNPYPSAPSVPVPQPQYANSFSEKKKTDKTGIGVAAVMIALALCAVAYIGWWFYSYYTKPLQPADVVLRLSDPLVMGNYNTLKKYLSQSTNNALLAKYGSEQGVSRYLKANLLNNIAVNGYGRRIQTGETTYENKDTALVEIVQPPDKKAKMSQLLGRDFKIQFVVVREDGQWKVNVIETSRRLEMLCEEAMRKQYGQFGMRVPQPNMRNSAPNFQQQR